MALEAPHFDLPFRFGPQNTAATVEQDSSTDIRNCVEAILRYPKGFCEEEPEFGITNPLFAEGEIDKDALRVEVEEWESRADLSTSTTIDPLDAAIQTIRVNVGT